MNGNEGIDYAVQLLQVGGQQPIREVEKMPEHLVVIVKQHRVKDPIYVGTDSTGTMYGIMKEKVVRVTEQGPEPVVDMWKEFVGHGSV